MGRRSLGMKGLERLAFKPDGYNFWKWKGRNIHYLVQGEGPAIVLIHGFGASVFHWRYNIPELSKRYNVYALDLLGFGWSEKAILDYDAMVWRDQVVDFLKEVVKEPAVLVGNSLGGFTALVSASELVDQVVGVVLLNSAGRFRDASDEVVKSEESLVQKYIVKPVKEIIQRFVIGLLFWQAKQPGRMQSVLNSVYIDKTNVDDFLTQSLRQQMIQALVRYTTGSDKALRIKEYYPNASLTFLKAGHCPHDEVPELENKALLEWLSGLNLNTSYQDM
ncbi:Pheophytinase, chloroplastic-like protein [Drosera capensis]